MQFPAKGQKSYAIVQNYQTSEACTKVLWDLTFVHRRAAVSIWNTVCLDIDKSLLSKENVVDFRILSNVERLTVLQLMDQFGHKTSQKKHKDVEYKFLKKFFKNILLYTKGQLSKIHSVHK